MHSVVVVVVVVVVVAVVLYSRPSIFGSCLYRHFGLPWGTMDAPGAKNGGGSYVSKPPRRGVSCLSSPPCESKHAFRQQAH